MKSTAKKRGKMSIKTVLTFFSIFSIMTPTEAFFRHLCFNPLGFGRIDPIVSPGNISQHLHHLHGSGNIGIDSVDAELLLESNCTSCSITADKSAYWAPAMYFQHESGEFELMTTSGSITIYYKTEKRVNFENQNYTTFPKGFRMIAGDASKRTWAGPWPVPEQSLWNFNDTTQSALASKALGFNCLNYKGHFDEATFAHGYLRDKKFVDAHCPQGIRAEILFPSCWDGVNLDSSNHQSHVAYPSLLQDGACPKSHPVYLPILFYETIWNTQDFAGKPGQFVFSNGDPTGYGYHADFIAAWEDGVLEAVMADPNCTDHDLQHRHTDGLQEHCPVFKGRLQSQEEAAKCKLVPPETLVHERFVGRLSALPGNIKITGQRHDPGVNPDAVQPSPVSSIASSLSPSVASSSSTSSNKSVPTPVLSVSKSSGSVASSRPTVRPSTFANKSSAVAPKPTVAPAPTPTPPKNSVLSTSTFFSNGVWYEMVVVQAWITVTAITSGNVSAPANTTTPIVTRRHAHGHFHHGAH